ncbi:MAG: GxxExxY protein [Patescibacteria group bacterium]|nr:GxxExxY protein [Patescibacteria group bacterium]
MNQEEDSEVLYKDLSYKIVGILYEVYNELGCGYPEKIYENAIAKSLLENGINYKRQAPYRIMFYGETIGRNYIDFIIEDIIVLEIKRGDYFSRKNIEQIKKYLAVTGMKLAILAHFTSNGVKIFRAFNPNNKYL